MSAFTITEYTDEQRAAEYPTESEPRLVTKSGKISAYGMACGYIYQVIADHQHGGFTRLTMTPAGDGYFVDYFDNWHGGRTKAYRHFERKRDAERCFDHIARVVRAKGGADIRAELPFEFVITRHTA